MHVKGTLDDHFMEEVLQETELHGCSAAIKQGTYLCILLFITETKVQENFQELI